MLAYLSILNIAVIEQAEISFYDGLNVLTGETGAGKSIIIDAIGMALGQRTAKDLIRTGKPKASVTAQFYPGDALWDKLTEFGIEKTDDSSLLLYREISADGRGLCKINGALSPLSVLKEIGKYLINIHGQQDTAVLYSPEKHIGLLDSWAKDDLEKPLQEYASLYAEYKRLKRAIEEISKNESDRLREIDLLEFQVQEISTLNIKENETEELESRISVLENSGKISEVLQEAYEALIAAPVNARDSLHQAMGSMQSIRDFSSELAALCEEISDIAYRMDDIGSAIDSCADSLDFDERELDSLNDRLYAIRQLCQKYRCSPSGLTAFFEKAQEKLEQLQNSAETAGKLQAEFAQIAAKMDKIAAKITDLRQKNARLLEKEIERQLAELNMPGAKFSIPITKTEGFTALGRDYAEFMISPNPGESQKPIAKIASGGELSRIMLALKSIIASYDLVETYIFDEIDTGISGRTAEKVADKLILVASRCQTIIITHSPHIASIADHHYLIDKQVEGQLTRTRLVLLDEEGRVREIARINSGTHLTETAIAHARELLRLRDEQKEK